MRYCFAWIVPDLALWGAVILGANEMRLLFNHPVSKLSQDGPGAVTIWTGKLKENWN